MAINVTFERCNLEGKNTFPKLMVIRTACCNSGTIVFFKKECSGTVLFGTDYWKDRVGHFSDSWCMADFEEFNEALKLKNEKS